MTTKAATETQPVDRALKSDVVTVLVVYEMLYLQ